MKKIFAFLFFISASSIAQPTEYFRDDFKDNTKKWYECDNDKNYVKITDGFYEIENKTNSTGRFFGKSVLLKADKDYEIEAKIILVSGGENSGYALRWGVPDLKYKLGYSFAITTNLMGAVFQNGNSLKSKKIENKINPIGEANILKVQKKENKIFFFLNDKAIFNIPSESFSGSNIGFDINGQIKIKVDYISVKQDGNEIKLIDNPINGYTKENLGENINSETDEIIPVISPDGKTIYVCRKNNPENISKEDDIWFSTKNEKGEWEPMENIGKPINNAGPNSPISASADGNSLLIMNTYNPDGTSLGPGISMSNRTKNGWSLPQTVDIKGFYNKNRYSNFCLSADKKVLLMAIERKDSYGDQDLYVSFDQGDFFSEPINMGASLNTFGIEMSPFLASDNTTLYFASNGHPGYGSADIFVSRRLDSTWTKWSEPLNLGPEINTEDWEAYYTIPASGDYAYLSSQKKSLGAADIFRIKQAEAAKPNPVVLIYGKVINTKTNQPIDANITYNNLETNKELGTAISNPNDGSYKIILPYGTVYSFMATKQGFYSVSDNIDVSAITKYEEIERNLYLTPVEVGEVIRLNNIFFDFDKATLKKESFSELDRLYNLLLENQSMIIALSGHTDNKGSDEYNLKLSDDRVQSVLKYLLAKGISAERLSAKGFGETKPIASNENEIGRSKNRRVEFTVIKK